MWTRAELGKADNRLLLRRPYATAEVDTLLGRLGIISADRAGVPHTNCADIMVPVMWTDVGI
jgi:hypothetical protein